MKASLRDDGEIVSIDLHGLNIDDAISICKKGIAEAYYRGRDKIKLIHGSSTSSLQFVNSTIKYRLYDLLQESSVQKQTSFVLKYEDYCVIGLRPDFEIDRDRITILDIN